MDSERVLTTPKTRTATPVAGARRTRIPTPIRVQGKPVVPTSTTSGRNTPSGRVTPSGRITPVPKGSGIPYRVETRVEPREIERTTRDFDRTTSDRAASRASSLTMAGVKPRPQRAATPMAMVRPGEFKPGDFRPKQRRAGGRMIGQSGRSFSMPTRPHVEMDRVDLDMRQPEVVEEEKKMEEEVNKKQKMDREEEEVKNLNVPEVKVVHEHTTRQVGRPNMPIHLTHTPPPENTSMESFVSAEEEPRSYSMEDMLKSPEPEMLTSQEMLARDHNDSTTALLRENPISRRHSLTVSLTKTTTDEVLLKHRFKTVAIETVTGGESRDPVVKDTQVTCSPDHVVVSHGTSHMTYPTCLYTWTLVDQKLGNPHLARQKLKYALVAIPIPISGLPNLARSASGVSMGSSSRVSSSRVSMESTSRVSMLSVDDSDKRRSSSFGRLIGLLRKKDREVVTKPYTPSSRDKPEYSLVMLFETKASQQLWKEKLGYALEGDVPARQSPAMTRHRPHTPPQDEDLGFKVDRDRLRNYMDVGGWSKLVRKRDSVVEPPAEKNEKHEKHEKTEKNERRNSRGPGTLRKSRSFKSFRESFYSSKAIDLNAPADTSAEQRDEARDKRVPEKETSVEQAKNGDGNKKSMDDAQKGFSAPVENGSPQKLSSTAASVVSDGSEEQTTLIGMFKNEDYHNRPMSSMSRETVSRDSSHFEVDLSRDSTLKRFPHGIDMTREMSEKTVTDGDSFNHRQKHQHLHQHQHQHQHQNQQQQHHHVPRDGFSRPRDSFSYDMQPHEFPPPREAPSLDIPDAEWTRLSTCTLNTTNSSCPITPVTPELEGHNTSPVIAAFSANTTPPINMLHTVPSHNGHTKSVSSHHHMTYSDHMNSPDHSPHVTPLKTPLWLPGHGKAKSDIRAALARDRGACSASVTPSASTADLLTLPRDRSYNDIVSLKSREFQLKNGTARPTITKTVSNPCLVDAADEADKMNKISSEAARLWLKRRQSVSSFSSATPVSLQQLVKEPAVRKMTRNVYNGQLPNWHALSQASSRAPGVPVPKA
ncbi:hypothetical protein CJU90_1148 [Yarrowia sp. C11]|nr:hypothetical protein CKK34_2562 [Yarrowia sp. E02]KAG5373447.1 hypothetical protein CJU90_1148 [Yarrowia sp. C11]